MYTITRKNRIREELQLCHENGDVALAVTVDINADDEAGKISAVNAELETARLALQKEDAGKEEEEKAGKAMLALFEAVFGKEQLQEILAFYEGREAEMILDVYPFVRDEILMKVFTAVNLRKKQIIELLGRKA